MSRDREAFIKAFDALTPANQTAIACIVFELAQKDQQVARLSKELMKLLPGSEAKEEE